MVRCPLPYDGAFFEFLRGQYEAVSRVAIGKAWRRHELGFAPSAGNKPLDINVINCGACHCRPALPPQLEQQRNKRWDISTHCLLNGSWNQMKPRSPGRCSVLTRRLCGIVSDGDVTSSGMVLLIILAREGPKSAVALARSEGLQPQSLSRLLNQLEGAQSGGWAYCPDGRDRTRCAGTVRDDAGNA